jgi:phosphoglycolate phosphatase
MEGALLFDLDGTLVDSLADIGASANAVRAAFGLPPASEAAIRAFVGDGALVLLERALAGAGPFDALRERAWALYQEHHAEQCTREVRPYPGVVEHLERWHGERRPLAVVTNKPARFAHAILEHLGLDRLLPVVIGGDTLGERKPSPAPVHEALTRLRAPAAGASLVGDGIQDLRAGKAAGVRTVAALFGFHDAAALRAEGADEYWSAFGVAE